MKTVRVNLADEQIEAIKNCGEYSRCDECPCNVTEEICLTDMICVEDRKALYQEIEILRRKE